MKTNRKTIYGILFVVAGLFLYKTITDTADYQIQHYVSKFGNASFRLDRVIASFESMGFQDGVKFIVANGELTSADLESPAIFRPMLEEAGRKTNFYGTHGKWFRSNDAGEQAKSSIKAISQCAQNNLQHIPQWEVAERSIAQGKAMISLEYFEDISGDNSGVSSLVYDASSKTLFYLYCNY